MIKQNKIKMLITSILIILPALFGFIVKDKLPEQMAIHWGIDGKADGFSGVLFAVLFIPFFLLALHWVCIFVTGIDNKKREQNKKVLEMVFWICPVISIYSSFIIYATAFGAELNMGAILSILIGVTFILVGNYMPKCKQNRTIGIKVTWALENEENWNMTHRFGGKVWVAGGFLFLITAFLPIKAMMISTMVLIAFLVLLPTLYSYLYYKKQLKEGRYTKSEAPKSSKLSHRATIIISLILVAVTAVVCILLCFTGELEITLNESSFTIKADYYEDITVDYSDIESIEYRENTTAGERVFGFGTPQLLMGRFKNEEFGNYTRYSYTKSSACVVMTVNGETLVVGEESNEATKEFYDSLSKNIGG